MDVLTFDFSPRQGRRVLQGGVARRSSFTANIPFTYLNVSSAPGGGSGTGAGKSGGRPGSLVEAERGEIGEDGLTEPLISDTDSLAGASSPPSVITTAEAEAEDEDRMNALEVAVLGKLKAFTSDPLVVRVVDAIWAGQITFYSSIIDSDPHHTTTSSTSAAAAAARKVVHLRPAARPKGLRDLLRVSKLRVPKYQHWMSVAVYVVFVWMYTQLVLSGPLYASGWIEPLFMVFVVGYLMDMLSKWYKSGLYFYAQYLLSIPDFVAHSLFGLFVVFRSLGIFLDSTSNEGEMKRNAWNVLACASVVVYPRLVLWFEPMLQGAGESVVLLRRIMRRVFVVGVVWITLLGFGFWQAFSALERYSSPEGEADAGKTLAWLLQVSLGNIALGFGLAPSYHLVLGPPLMLLYVALLTILPIAVIIATVARAIPSSSSEEEMKQLRPGILSTLYPEYRYEFTLHVLEQVKAESLFPLPVPYNLINHTISFFEMVGFSEDAANSIRRFLARLVGCWMLIGIFIWERWFEERSPSGGVVEGFSTAASRARGASFGQEPTTPVPTPQPPPEASPPTSDPKRLECEGCLEERRLRENMEADMHKLANRWQKMEERFAILVKAVRSSQTAVAADEEEWHSGLDELEDAVEEL